MSRLIRDVSPERLRELHLSSRQAMRLLSSGAAQRTTGVAFKAQSLLSGAPMTPRFNPPPNWPQPPAGWVYPVGWQPDPNWPAPPDRWPFWVDEGHPTPPQSEAPTIPIDLPLNSGAAPAATAVGNLAPLASP